ncbi:MAG: prepilin-type N-terminal cleavage/methylation domain-containing protein [Anaerotignum sp.]
MKKIMKKRDNKGFTLMEMLIVIGIIAILIAIAIPTFTGATTSAKYATDSANVRSWYAEALIANMAEGTALPTNYDGPDLQLDSATVDITGTTADTFEITYKPNEAGYDDVVLPIPTT